MEHLASYFNVNSLAAAVVVVDASAVGLESFAVIFYLASLLLHSPFHLTKKEYGLA